MAQSSRRSSFKLLVAERLEQRFVFDGSVSPIESGMGDDVESLHAETALVSQFEGVKAFKTTPIWATSDAGTSTEFRLELDGFPVAQELRDNKLFLVLNLPDGTAKVDEFDVSDLLKPQRISSVKIPRLVNTAEFFENVLVLQTMEQSDLLEVAPELTIEENWAAIEPSQLGEDLMYLSDAFSGFFPMPTIQVLELDHLANGVVTSHTLSVPIEHVFVIGSDLFVVTSNAFGPTSPVVRDEMSGIEFDWSPQSPFVPQTPQTNVERFGLDIQTGRLNYKETILLDGMIMSTDLWQSETSEGLALLVQSFTDMPHTPSGRVSIQGFTLTTDGDVDTKRIPVTLPWGDNWVSSFDFEDGRSVIGSPQGLTLVDATGTGPVVLTSLIYENQFSTWAHLDDQFYLRIANDIDSNHGSIAGKSVVLDVLDVSDLSHPKTIVSKTLAGSDDSVRDWMWSIFENHILKQSDGKYLLVIPTSSNSAESLNADLEEEGEWIPMDPSSLPWLLESNLQLISIALWPASIDSLGEFTIVGAMTEVHLKGDMLTAMGYNERVVVNLSEQPITPIRIAMHDLDALTADPIDADQIESISNKTARNIASPTDANNDGNTNQLDVLNLINELNLRGSYALANGSDVHRALLPDVDGDLWLTPLDVLVVINWINRTSNSGFNVQAESSPRALELPSLASQTESAKSTGEKITSLDDSFASLSIDWDLHDEDLSNVMRSIAKPFTRPATGLRRLVRN